jgi:hypothetical protein
VRTRSHPRYTNHLDIWIDSTRENAQRLVLALDQFGFGPLGLRAHDFLAPNQQAVGRKQDLADLERLA